MLPFAEVTLRGARVRAARFPLGAVNVSRALICVPGYAANGESFARLQPISTDWDIRLLTPPEDALSHDEAITRFAALLVDYAAQFDRPVLLGTSFGGLVAMEAAKQMGSQISGLILISTFARVGRIRRCIVAAARPFIGFAAAHMQQVGLRFIGSSPLDSTTSAELLRQANSISRMEKDARLRAALSADFRTVARSIAVPVLVIHGTHDPIVPIAAARQLCTLLPNAGLIEIPLAGHIPYLTHAADTNAAIAGFLARLRG